MFFCLLVCAFQVRQWITDRVTTNSPVSPSTSSSYPGSSTTDWSTPRRERCSPLRGPHGKFVSPSSVGGYSSSSSPPDQSYIQRSRGERHTDMAELAKHVSERIFIHIFVIPLYEILWIRVLKMTRFVTNITVIAFMLHRGMKHLNYHIVCCLNFFHSNAVWFHFLL